MIVRQCEQINVSLRWNVAAWQRDDRIDMTAHVWISSTEAWRLREFLQYFWMPMGFPTSEEFTATSRSATKTALSYSKEPILDCTLAIS